LAQVVVTAPLNGEFPGGSREFDIDAGSVFELVRKLDALSPGAAEFIEGKVSIAVDGQLIGDWSTALSRASEVLLVPHIAGG
jgi:molybdopterin converting factor small subunit